MDEKEASTASANEVLTLFVDTANDITYAKLVLDSVDECVQADDCRNKFFAQLKAVCI